jgi:hypothetical protein
VSEKLLIDPATEAAKRTAARAAKASRRLSAIPRRFFAATWQFFRTFLVGFIMLSGTYGIYTIVWQIATHRTCTSPPPALPGNLALLLAFGITSVVAVRRSRRAWQGGGAPSVAHARAAVRACDLVGKRLSRILGAEWRVIGGRRFGGVAVERVAIGPSGLFVLTGWAPGQSLPARQAVDGATAVAARLNLPARVTPVVVLTGRRPRPPIERPEPTWHPTSGIVLPIAVGIHRATRKPPVARTGQLVDCGDLAVTLVRLRDLGSFLAGGPEVLSESEILAIHNGLLDETAGQAVPDRVPDFSQIPSIESEIHR